LRKILSERPFDCHYHRYRSLPKKENCHNGQTRKIRENVARALEEADGDRVVAYVIHSLAEEDRSQRCRIVLSRQLAERIPIVEEWFELLLREPAIRDLAEKQGLENSVTRLRDISLALC
jgi:hypothetical protein